MKKALVVGGNSGIGLALVIELIKRNYDHVYIVGKDLPKEDDVPLGVLDIFKDHTSSKILNLNNQDYELFSEIRDIDTLIITTGFGRVTEFENLTEAEINNLVKCNLLSEVQLIKKYYDKIKSKENFYCVVMGSIAGHIASPLFSVYGAAKSGLCAFVENVNAELAYKGIYNRILNVSPGALKGTNFNGDGNKIELLSNLAGVIIDKMYSREVLYIPLYKEIYSDVIERYRKDPIEFGKESCEYKIVNGRCSNKAQVVVGYLSGTFDLFHIGHLNLLRRAKEYCDYLIVGVHESGSWKGKQTFIPFEERLAIINSIKYVDKAVKSFTEDTDAYEAFHFDKLFVGSDYKGSERFKRYEEYFKEKGVEIVYFPYTQGTSSTQLRDAITKK